MEIQIIKSLIIRKVEVNQFQHSRNEFEFRGFAVIINIHVHNCGGVILFRLIRLLVLVNHCLDKLTKNLFFLFGSKNN